LRDAFRSFDIEKSGEITESKFLEGILSMNAQVSEDQIRAVFKAIDMDGNGRINFDEFCHMAQKRPLKMDHNRVN
jgi:Ca2+-binding EF-hand superfamily protein